MEKCGLGKTGIYDLMKIDQNAVIKMFDILKEKVYSANQFGLASLNK